MIEVQKTKDTTSELKQRLNTLFTSAVIIGTKTHGEELYLNEYGEPAEGIQANPFFMEGIQKAQNTNIDLLRNGVKDILSKRDTITGVLSEVGDNSVKIIKQEGRDNQVDSGLINLINAEVIND